MPQRLSSAQKLILALFGALILFLCINQLAESDSFYHLRTGQLIWETKAIPHADVFSYPALGAPWVAHEWLAELFFYGAYHVGGFVGLRIFVALLGLLAAWFVYASARRRGANFYLTLVLIVLLSLLTFELWIPRPQVFAFLSLAALVYLLDRFRREGKILFLAFAVATIWFWANTNASFILGLVVFFFFGIAELFQSFFPRWFSDWPSRRRNGLLVLGGALVATGLSCVNPNGYHIFFYSRDIQEAVKLLNVLEWQPITHFLARIQSKIWIGMAALSEVLLILWYGIRRKSRDLTTLGVVTGVAILPFISIRHVGFWPMIAVAPLAAALSDLGARLWAEKERLLRFGAIVFVLALLFVRLGTFKSASVNATFVPVDAANFIDQNHLAGPMFNLYNEGGYLIWPLWPEQKVFLDGRSEVYRGQPLQDFLTIVHASQGTERLVDQKYKLNFFLVGYRSARSVTELVLYLLQHNWPLIYWDDQELIFVRNVPTNQALIAEYGLRHVNPFRDAASIPQSEAKAAGVELQSLLDREPASQVIADYTRRFLETHPR